MTPVRCSSLLRLLAWLPLAAFCAQAQAAAEAPQAGAIAHCLKIRRSEPQAAMTLAESILAAPGLPIQSEIKTLSCLGMAAGYAGDRKQAADAAELIESKVDQHPELPADFTLRALSNAGAIQHGAGHVHQAEILYTRVNEIAKSVSDKDAAITQVVMLTNIGAIHADYMDSPEAGERYYREALTIAEGIGYENLQLLFNHALNLVQLDLRDDARAALERAEAAAMRQDDSLLRQRIRSERAGLMIAEGDAVRARALLGESLAVQRRLPDPAGESSTLSKLSTLQRSLGDRQAALDSAQTALRLVESGQYPTELMEALRAGVAAQAALGRVDEALATARRLHDLQMAALKEQRLEILADLQASLQDSASQREVERLRHEGQIRALNLEKAHLMRNATFAILGLLLMATIAFLLMQRRRHRLLREISATDALTGLTNRRAATQRLNALTMTRVQAALGTRHVLFIIDIDHFKQVNDGFGHHAGDGVLVQISRCLQAACKPEDIVARWGGEEFLVVCQDLTQERACAMAERLCQALTYNAELAPGQFQSLTVSLGFAPFPFFSGVGNGTGAWGYSIRMADRALYAAKDRRNAWAGFWGGHSPTTATPDQVLEHPEDAVRAGDIAVVASYPMVRR
jgi:diguanylate cyclase (GGDEF)-like protein